MSKTKTAPLIGEKLNKASERAFKDGRHDIVITARQVEYLMERPDLAVRLQLENLIATYGLEQVMSELNYQYDRKIVG